MAGIKDRFKAGLRSAGSKLGNAALGSPEMRRERDEFETKRRSTWNTEYKVGRLQETKRQARRAGRASVRGGGFLMAGVRGFDSGLHAANSVLGFPVERPKRVAHRREHRRKKQRRSYVDDDSFLVF